MKLGQGTESSFLSHSLQVIELRTHTSTNPKADYSPCTFLKSNFNKFQISPSPVSWSYDQLRQHIKKQRHYYFVNKGPSSQGYGFSSSHVWMWQLDCEESWVPKNWCFWTVVLEKTVESPLDCKEIKPILKKISPEYSLEGLMLKLNLPYFGHLM